MNTHLRFACLFLLAALVAWAAVPRVTSVKPPFGQNGETLVVNGEVVNRGRGSSLTEGRILIQSEGAEVYFRRFELRPVTQETE